MPFGLLAAAAMALAGCARGVGTRAQPMSSASVADAIMERLAEQARRGFVGSVLVAQGARVVVASNCIAASCASGRSAAYWIGSTTKPLTATAIMKLVEQHRIALSDTIGRFFRDVPADKRSITLGQLLTHTSGIGQHYAADTIVDRAKAIAAILAPPLDFIPGARFGYSNDGYNLLAAVIEVASGTSYETYMRRTLITPAKMTETGFWGEPITSTEALPAPIPDAFPRRRLAANYGYRGATGIRSTNRDLYREVRAFLAGTIVAPATVEAMLAPQTRASPARYWGLGWVVDSTPEGRVMWFTGAESGLEHYSAVYHYIDRDVTIVVLGRGDEDLVNETARLIRQAAFFDGR